MGERGKGGGRERRGGRARVDPAPFAESGEGPTQRTGSAGAAPLATAVLRSALACSIMSRITVNDCTGAEGLGGGLSGSQAATSAGADYSVALPSHLRL